MAQVSSFPIAQVCWSTSSVASYAHSSLNDCGGVPNNVTTSLSSLKRPEVRQIPCEPDQYTLPRIGHENKLTTLVEVYG
eukprot:1189934-Prorocentrum_minimum.AAC.3